MSAPVRSFCDWLAATPFSLWIKTVDWLIPAVQTVHILSIALVMAAAAIINLRVLGLLGRRRSVPAVALRIFPWIWWTLPVLLLSGSVLIIGEPARSLPNPAFVLKMAMLVVAAALTATLQSGMRHDPGFWEQSTLRRWGARAAALGSLALWVGIVFAGRWIAYVDVDAA